MQKMILLPLLFAAACSSGTGYVRSFDPIPAQSGLVIVTTGYSFEYRNSISSLAPVETDPRALSLRYLDVGQRCSPGDATITLTGPAGNVTITDGYSGLVGGPPRYSAGAYSSSGGYGKLVENRDIFTFMLPAGKYTLRTIECEPPKNDQNRPSGLAGVAMDMVTNSQRMKTAIAQRINFEVKPAAITHLGQIEVMVKATRTGTISVERELSVKTSAGLTDQEIREELLRGRMSDFPIVRASTGPNLQNVTP